MLFAGFCTFALLYAVQPLLPLFAAQYRLSAEVSSLSVFLLYLLGSASSAWFGSLAGRIGRRHVFWVAVSVGGSVGGIAWSRRTWLGVIWFGLSLALAGLAAAIALSRVKPLAIPDPPGRALVEA